MTAMNSTQDGMGFEEVNQTSYTDVISGATVYANWIQGVTYLGGVISGDQVHCDVVNTNVWVSGPTLIGNTISGTTLRVGGEGVVHSTAIDNATQLFGYRVKAGSVLIGDYGSGLLSFPSAGSFSTANYFLTISARDYGVPQWSRTGSCPAYGTSGLRRASGCWIVGGSSTVVDWIAVGI